jgi:uncharacterized protein YndB with AHSA1/START domain
MSDDTLAPARPEEVPAEDAVIRVSREIKAPRARVWAAWTDPSRIGAWWGPHGFDTTTHAWELRPGGTWRFTMHGPDGKDYENRVVWDEVSEPERLAYTHYDAGGATEEPHFLARVEFVETAAGTRVTLTMRLPSLARRDELVAFGALEGGRQTLARFAALVEA